MHRLLSLMVLLPHLNASAQIDQRKVDSLARLIDSSANARQQKQESTIKTIDSNYQSQLNKALQGSHNLDNYLAEQKRREARERQQTIVRNLLGVLLLIIGLIALVRRKRPKP